MKKTGLIQIYTGDGKGKTTASVGLAVRARGHGMKVCYIYFHKDPERWNYGEHKILKKIGVSVLGFAEKHPHFYKKIKASEMRKECIKGLECIKKIYLGKKYDMVILDEINISVRDGYLDEGEVMEIIRVKPEYLELVLTGRGATKNMIKAADLVSKVEKVKHPYDLNVQRRMGVEY
ncbi:MAG: cob(I)yrinic acid a,c-diamide adenosyltransferase [Candidatus Omnitrophota bacterium]|jgi:cob(I)alamin adenosyltransferase